MKKGKFTSLMLAGMMAVTTLAGCGSGGKQAASKVDTSEAAQGKVLNIYCWNTEVRKASVRCKSKFRGYTE